MAEVNANPLVANNAMMSLLGGYAWSHQFKLTNLIPTVNGIDISSISVVSAKLPSRKLNTAKVPFGAFEVNVPMNITFPDNLQWPITFQGDQSGLTRNFFSVWQNLFYNVQNQKGTPNFGYSLTLDSSTDKTISGGGTVINKKNIIDRLTEAIIITDPIPKTTATATIRRIANSGNFSNLIKYAKVQQKSYFDQKKVTEVEETINSSKTTNKTTNTNIISTPTKFILHGCYPIMLDNVVFSANTPNLLQLSTVLAYQYYTQE